MTKTAAPMTSGSIWKQMTFFAMPIFLGNLFQQLYNTVDSLIVGNLGINQGMILENMVAQMLRASGHDLYFHEYLYRPEGSSREKKYEIDFMTVKKKKICPIEVKSSGYTSHKSFDYLIRNFISNFRLSA